MDIRRYRGVVISTIALLFTIFSGIMGIATSAQADKLGTTYLRAVPGSDNYLQLDASYEKDGAQYLYVYSITNHILSIADPAANTINIIGLTLYGPFSGYPTTVQPDGWEILGKKQHTSNDVPDGIAIDWKCQEGCGLAPGQTIEFRLSSDFLPKNGAIDDIYGSAGPSYSGKTYGPMPGSSGTPPSVPEPSATLLAISGFGSIGAFRQYLKRKASDR